MTLARTPEPELMDGPEQARAYAGADFTAAHGAILDALSARLPDFPSAGAVLELGCGAGDVAVRLAQRLPAITVDALDGAEAMLAHARERIDHEGLQARIRLHRLTLPAAALPRSQWQAVVSNSLLHHLHEPSVFWHTVATAARPGAPIFIADLARPADAATVDALAAAEMADAPAILQHDFHASLHAAFTPDEVRAQLAAAGLALNVETLDDHHLVIWGYR
jgi:2-polyprenyl-3-methyl-5-hydroxy-6-metoxy-1,4-benzoquinol methylase